MFAKVIPTILVGWKKCSSTFHICSIRGKSVDALSHPSSQPRHTPIHTQGKRIPQSKARFFQSSTIHTQSDLLNPRYLSYFLQRVRFSFFFSSFLSRLLHVCVVRSELLVTGFHVKIMFYLLISWVFLGFSFELGNDKLMWHFGDKCLIVILANVGQMFSSCGFDHCNSGFIRCHFCIN